MPPPRLVQVSELAAKPDPQRKQWFYDGESWVLATEQPPIKPLRPVQDPVSTAVMENIRGKYNKPEKPKVRPGPTGL